MAESLLYRVAEAGVKVDVNMLKAVFQALSNARNPTLAIEKAEQLYNRYLKSGKVIATTSLINTFMDIYSKSRLSSSAETAEDILLNRMPVLKVIPDRVSYNTVISCWSRSRDASAFVRAERIFAIAKSKGVSLDIISYSSLLTALTRHITNKKKNSVDRADLAKAAEIFQTMLATGTKPDLQFWTIFIGIWAKCQLYEETQSFFENMISSGIEPNDVTYTTMLNMWGNSKHPSASEQIVLLFKRMKAAGKQLDTVGYTSLLSSLSRSREPVLTLCQPCVSAVLAL